MATADADMAAPPTLPTVPTVPTVHTPSTPPVSLAPTAAAAPSTPPPSGQKPPGDPSTTPLNPRHPTTNQFSQYIFTADPHRQYLADDMKGQFVGPMEPKVFMESLMQVPEDVLSSTDFTKFQFSGDMKHNLPENDLYPELVEELTKWKPSLFPQFKFMDTSHTPDTDTGLKPDILFVKEAKHRAPNMPSFERWNWHITEVHIELATNYDLFTSDETAHPESHLLNVKNAAAVEKAAQIGSYVAAQMSRQHRNIVFSIFMWGDNLRFIRWERSGAIVSRAVDYRKNPQTLAEFLFRYSHMTPEHQGYDPTVQLASRAEKNKLANAVTAYMKSSKRQLPGMGKAIDRNHAAYKMLAVDKYSGIAKEYIVQCPTWYSLNPFGRCTHGYVAYDITDGRLVFVKDSWRVEGAESEADIYERIVPREIDATEYPELAALRDFLPNVISAGDVRSAGDPEEKPQCTRTHHYARLYRRLSNISPVHGYIHHRVVEEIFFPLETFASSRELVQSLRDAMFVVVEVYKQFKRLHRDVSAGNVMIKETGRGVMNDWDHSTVEEIREMLLSFRTGTWQFLSIGLLKNSKKVHTILDDLESFLWVLTYMGLHHLEHTFDREIGMFDEYEYAKSGSAIGGLKKRAFLQAPSGKFASEPLQWLVTKLRAVFRVYYNKKDEKDNGDSDDFDEYHQRLLNNPSEVLDLFDVALQSDGWEDNDKLENDKYPQVSQATEQKQVRKTQQSSSFLSSSKNMGTSSARQEASGCIPHLPATAESDFLMRHLEARDLFVGRHDLHLLNTPDPTPSLASTSSKRNLSRSGIEADEPEAERPSKKKRKTATGSSVRSGGMHPPPTPPSREGSRRSLRLSDKAKAKPASPQGSSPKQTRGRKRSGN